MMKSMLMRVVPESLIQNCQLLVSIVIVSYNSKKDLFRCLKAIQSQSYSPIEVIVVDNASSDESAEFVERNYPTVKLIRNIENSGYAGGNNLGFAVAQGDYIFMLNPDTEMDTLCVERLANTLMRNEKIGICGAKLLLLSHPDTLQHAGGRYHVLGISVDRGMLERDNGQYDLQEEVTFVCGAALMFKKKLLLEIGEFDKSFFMYHEEVDFCIRALLHNYSVVYVPTAIVYHKSAFFAEISNEKSNPIVVFHKHKNTYIILLKNFPFSTIIQWYPVSIFYKVFWVTKFLTRRDSKSAIATIKSIWWVFPNLGNILQKRLLVCQYKRQMDQELKSSFVSLDFAWNTYHKLSEIDASMYGAQRR
jgi:GT2 family glycosyltransferase